MTTPATHLSVATALALVALLGTPPSHAQGALKPVEALIVNPANRPVPVSIVGAPAPPTAMCRIDMPTGNPATGVSAGATSFPVSELICSNGVSRLDVHRVVAGTADFPAPGNLPVHFNLVVGLGRPASPGYVIDIPIATLSSGTPDLALARPVRIDKGAPLYMLADQTCSTGIVGVVASCMRAVYLIGTPVN
jgi:hypothetical protein